MTNDIQFNDKAHSIISDLLDRNEDRLVRNRDCEPERANDRLAYDYIMRCATMSRGATTFIFHDERVGTECFLFDLHGSLAKIRSKRNRVACTAQLMQFQRDYFPQYNSILRLTYLNELSKIDHRQNCILNGVIKLAAAKLPNVRSDIRRKLRSLGYGYDALLVADDTLERELARPRAGIFTISLDNTSESA
ncbi:MAG: hypothetical protein J0I47_00215 [Sphingomonas sp.]|uniref:hypothetical protein n=1 Tax=Sphingomonas sp. TaxID=28214 RepID=UPI001ACE41FC|nr:hypothetical protein [Sphingomonas sp.]MBN8806652.1 hypothetical protein [Sphingomonas sp.]